jgi:hypothetical protein
MSIEMDAWQEKYADLAPGQRAWYWHCPPEGIQGLSDNTRIAYQVTRAQDGALWVQVGELPLPVLAGFPCGERCWEAAEVAALRGRLADFEDDFRQVMAEGCGKIDDGWDTVTQHCACVPHLRRRVRELEATVAAVDAALRMRDEATYHADPPALPLAKRVAEECAWERQRGRGEAREEVQAWIAARMAEATQRPEVYEGERWGLATVSDELRRLWKEHP